MATMSLRTLIATARRRLARHLRLSAAQGWTTTHAALHPHPFDLAFGTDTGGLIPARDLSTGFHNNAWNTAYYGIAPSVFHQALDALQLDWPNFAFIDLGSGKGRALLLASRLPFQRILGVELAPELSAIAAANIQRFAAPWQACRTIEAITGDAATFQLPRCPLVLFLYHPFLPPVLQQCLDNLTRSLAIHPRQAYLVYVNPLHQDVIARTPGMVHLWEKAFPYSAEEAAADTLHGTGDRVSAWRSDRIP